MDPNAGDENSLSLEEWSKRGLRECLVRLRRTTRRSNVIGITRCIVLNGLDWILQQVLSLFCCCQLVNEWVTVVFN